MNTISEKKNKKIGKVLQRTQIQCKISSKDSENVCLAPFFHCF